MGESKYKCPICKRTLRLEYESHMIGGKSQHCWCDKCKYLSHFKRIKNKNYD